MDHIYQSVFLKMVHSVSKRSHSRQDHFVCPKKGISVSCDADILS